MRRTVEAKSISCSKMLCEQTRLFSFYLCGTSKLGHGYVDCRVMKAKHFHIEELDKLYKDTTSNIKEGKSFQWMKTGFVHGKTFGRADYWRSRVCIEKDVQKMPFNQMFREVKQSIFLNMKQSSYHKTHSWETGLEETNKGESRIRRKVVCGTTSFK